MAARKRALEHLPAVLSRSELHARLEYIRVRLEQLLDLSPLEPASRLHAFLTEAILEADAQLKRRFQN